MAPQCHSGPNTCPSTLDAVQPSLPAESHPHFHLLAAPSLGWHIPPTIALLRAHLC
jgi:hypothetical protein